MRKTKRCCFLFFSVLLIEIRKAEETIRNFYLNRMPVKIRKITSVLV